MKVTVEGQFDNIPQEKVPREYDSAQAQKSTIAGVLVELTRLPSTFDAKPFKPTAIGSGRFPPYSIHVNLTVEDTGFGVRGTKKMGTEAAPRVLIPYDSFPDRSLVAKIDIETGISPNTIVYTRDCTINFKPPSQLESENVAFIKKYGWYM